MKIKYLIALSLIFNAHCATTTAANNRYSLPNKGKIIGSLVLHTINGNRPLTEIAKQYKVGILALLESNPHVTQLFPKLGTVITIPTQAILPSVKAKADEIVINLSELRLYHFHKNHVSLYPIAVGSVEHPTPLGSTSIIQKKENPIWRPTTAKRKRYLAEQGSALADKVLPGPDNPLGKYAMRLGFGKGVYLIHGTNENFGVGFRTTSGCISLRDEDIKMLFNEVKTGTKVHIIDEPIKYSIEADGQHYIEVHQPLSKSTEDDPKTAKLAHNNAFKKFIMHPNSDVTAIEVELKKRIGIPVAVHKVRPTAEADL